MIVQIIPELGKITKDTDKAPKFMPTVKSILENLKIICLKVKVRYYTLTKLSLLGLGIRV